MKLSTVLVLAFALFAASQVAGCLSYEGAGFSNRGVAPRPACIKERRGNVERWGNC